MAGRAGRRGIDTAGTVIIVSRDDEPPPVCSQSSTVFFVNSLISLADPKLKANDSRGPYQATESIPADVHYDFESTSSRGTENRGDD